MRTSRSEEHTSELQSLTNLVCRLPLRSLLFPYTTLFRSAAADLRPAQRALSARLRCGLPWHVELARVAGLWVRGDAAGPAGHPRNVRAGGVPHDADGSECGRVDRKSTRLNSSH